MTIPIAFDNSYATLPERFFVRTAPTPAAAPRLIKLNVPLAQQLRMDVAWLQSPSGLDMLSGRAMPEGAEPLAATYAGHQFGNFVPQLGDGRALLLGEVVDRDGVRRDVQLKGAGRTAFSRGGDGRAALGPVLREYIVSEAMAALGIPTTRALAAVTTGQPVMRESELPGAVLTRVASSHIRIGTFQFFAARGDGDAVKALADYAIARHDPDAARAARAYRAFLDGVIGRQASLVARWLAVGFIHGVMNTDNTTISGETIDYGPCAFVDAYDPAKVFSSIDQFGRYAYGNQARIALWNLTRLAECLLPLLADDEKAAVGVAEEALGAFAEQFNVAYLRAFRAKMGLSSPRDEDANLLQDLLKSMAKDSVDFTLAFRALCDAQTDANGFRALFEDKAAVDKWLAQWRARLSIEPLDAEARRDAMRGANPAFIPRNHRIAEAIEAAMDDDFEPFERLCIVLTKPFEDQPAYADYMKPPAPHECVLQTFCGT